MSEFATAPAQAAAILVARRLAGLPGERLPETCRPADLAAALAIQAQVSAQIGDSVGGWKCGMPADGRLVLAPIYTASIHRGSEVPLFARKGMARIEPELAFVLAHHLPLRSEPYSEAEIDAAIGSVHLALELIQSRYLDPASLTFAEALADGLVNQGLLLGPAVPLAVARQCSELALQIEIGSATIDKAGKHPATQPLAPLYWLVEFLRQSGQGLAAGQVVITGSYAGVLELPLDQPLSIHFGQLGQIDVRFCART